MDYNRKVASLAIMALLFLSCPYVSNNLLGKIHASATSLVFFGTSHTLVLNGNSVELTLNLTNVDPTPINATVQAVIDDTINGQPFEIVNSSVVMLMPSTPTIVNMTINALTLCTNYSMLIDVLSVSGAILTPIRQIFSFPCEAYGSALTLSAPISIPFPCLSECANMTFTNHLNVALKAVVIAGFHNSIGQIVSLGTASIVISPGGTSSAFVVAQGISPGTYNVIVFVWDVDGTPISPAYLAQLNFT